MEKYNLMDQLMAQQPQGQGMLMDPSQQPGMPEQKSFSLEAAVKKAGPPPKEIAPLILSAFEHSQKFPTSAEEFSNLIKRQTEGLAGQREGVSKLESQIGELTKATDDGPNLAPLMAISDLLSGTKNLQNYKSPAMKAKEAKMQGLALQMQLQKSKNDLTDKEIDLFKAQYQDSRDREKMKQMMDLEKMKLGAENRKNMLPGQEAADKAFGQEYTAWNQKGDRAGYLKSKESLESAINELSNDPSLTGTIAMKATPAGMVSKFHPNSATVEQKVKSTVIQMVKQLGANPTDTDLREIQKTVWDKDLPTETNIEKIRSFLQEQERKAAAKDEASKYFESTRGTLMGQGMATSRKPTPTAPSGGKAPLSYDEWVKAGKPKQ